MIQLSDQRFVFGFVVLTSCILAGCASVAVSNDAIVERTAFALSLDKSAFTISNRVDDGVRSSFSVKTNAGKSYNCYVGGSISVVGRVVSDAICNEVGVAGGAVKPAGAAAPAANCNALLKAANRC
jgi:hypothetical protein